MNRSRQYNRRRFLSQTGQLGLGVATTGLFPSWTLAQSSSPNEQIVLAMVGIRGRGALHSTGFAKRDDCQIAYLCDPDSRLFGTPASRGYMRFTDPNVATLPRADAVERLQGKRPQLVADLRRALDDKAVDAICVSTPDHWHALATVWGCQAGKHVYVEKPISHTPWEGRKMVEAARKYGRVVQAGTQSRSAPYIHKAKEYIDSGKLGKIHLCRVYDQKQWGNVQPVPDVPTPDGLNWNLWNGPASQRPYNFNYWEHWNHFWDYSGGDIINDSIHQIDLARWLTGRTYPISVYSTGGRWAEQGAFETPDTQVVTYEFDNMVMQFEMTLNTPYMILADQELRDSDIFPHWPQNASRIELFGTKGLMVLGRHGMGWQVFDRPKSRQPVVVAQEYGRWTDDEHKDDFFDAIREGRRPIADIEEAHLSTLYSQYGNISYRLGSQKLVVDPRTESFSNSRAGNEMLKRQYRDPYVIPKQV